MSKFNTASSKKTSSVIRDFKDLTLGVKKVYEEPVSDIQEQNFSNLYHDGFQQGFLETDKVAVVIDGNSLHKVSKEIEQKFFAPKNERFSIDYRALDEVLYANFPKLPRKWYVTPQFIVHNNSDEKDGYSNIRRLLDYLCFNRYEIVTKDIYIVENLVSQTTDEVDDEEIVQAVKPVYNSSNYHISTSMDVEIVSTLFKAAHYADHIIFFGSDKKFIQPLTILKDTYGKCITVVSSCRIDRNYVATELRKGFNFVELADEFFFENIRSKKNSHQE